MPTPQWLQANVRSGVCHARCLGLPLHRTGVFSQHLASANAGGFNGRPESAFAQVAAGGLHHACDDFWAETFFNGISQGDAGGLR